MDWSMPVVLILLIFSLFLRTNSETSSMEICRQFSNSESWNFQREKILKNRQSAREFPNKELVPVLMDFNTMKQFCKPLNVLVATKSISSKGSSVVTHLESHHGCAYFTKFASDIINQFQVGLATYVRHSSDNQAKNEMFSTLRCLFQNSKRPFSARAVNMNKPLSLISTQIRTIYIFASDIDELENSLGQVGTLDQNVLLLSRKTQKTIDFMKKLPIQFDSNILLYEDFRDSYVVYEVYRIDANMPIEVKRIGSWSKSGGLKMTASQIWERRKDLQGLSVIVSAANYPRWTGTVKSPDGSIELKGRQPEIWRRLEQSLNLTTNFIESPDGQYGMDLGNGTFDGVIGLLQRKQATIGINGFTLTASRAGAADPLLPLGSFITGLMYKVESEDNESFAWTIYLSPFQRISWLSIMVVILVCAVLFAAAIKIAPVGSKSFEFGLEMILHAFLEQGSPRVPRSLSARGTFWVMFVTGMLLWFAYSATLTSFLAAKHEKPPFSTLEEMLQATNYKIVTTQGSVNVDMFKYGTDVQREIFKSRLYTLPTMTDTIEELDKEVSIVNFIEKTAAEAIIGQSCNYKWIPRWQKTYLFAFFTQKESPLTPLFNYHISKLRESGDLAKLEEDWFGRKTDISCASPETRPFAIEKVASLFILLIIFYSTVIMCSDH